MSSLKNRLLLAAARYAGPCIINTYSRTLRIRTEGTAHTDRYFHGSDDAIFAFWHGNMFPLIHLHRNQRVHILISRHRDGEYVSRIVEGVGYRTIRGSSTSGGSRALAQMIRTAGSGKNFAFTPDGPKGPRHRVKPGVIYFAGQSGLPVIPVGTAAEHAVNLKSWDRYLIPKPFSRTWVVYGEPLTVPGNLDTPARNRYVTELEQRITAATERAETLAGTCRADAGEQTA